MNLHLLKKNILFAATLYLGCTSSLCREYLSLPLPKLYGVQKTTVDMTMDGLLNEEAWENAEWTDLFMDIQGPDMTKPYYDTKVKMLWDKDYFYIYAEMEEEHVWGDIEERDAVIFYNNDFEVFIKPNERQPYYAEFEVNALGTLWDLFLARPYRRNGPVLDEWDIPGTKIGIDIKGSLNNPQDLDQGWSVEMAVPIAPINGIDRGHSFGEGSMWRVNFSRVQWEYQLNNGKYEKKTDVDGRRLPENNWVWSPQMAIDMHRPEHWGYVYFLDNKIQTEEDVEIDPAYATAYQLLFHLYRQQLSAIQSNQDEKQMARKLERTIYEANNYSYTAKYLPTDLGFELRVQHDSGLRLSINQDGYIRSSSEK